MITLPTAPSYKMPTAVSNWCYICGRTLRNPKHMIHVHGGGTTVVTEEEAKKLSQSEDMGGWYVGPECLKNYPELKPYVAKESL